MNILPFSLFIATCLAADKSALTDDSNTSANSNSLAIPICQPPKYSHPFLHIYDFYQRQKCSLEHSFGFALGANGNLTTYSDEELEIKVSKQNLVEIIKAEYPEPTWMSNPFSESLYPYTLLAELTHHDSWMTLLKFRGVMLKCAKNTYEVKLSVDIAILRWLVDAIKMNPNLKLDPSWIPHFSSLISERGIIELLEDDIIFFLDHLQGLIDSNSLSMQQLSPLLDGFRNIVTRGREVIKDVLLQSLRLPDNKGYFPSTNSNLPNWDILMFQT